MLLKNKKVLVVGLAVSGIPTISTLHQLGAIIDVNDIKKEDLFSEEIKLLQDKVNHFIFDGLPKTIEGYDIFVLSPGVPTDLPFILEAKSKGVLVIGELELAYQLTEGKFIAITGTNGKTTTTALVGEIFSASGKTTEVVGNIGVPVISRVLESTVETYFVTEVSSFQLESTLKFAPKVAAILNVTPDHLNRHKTMENYIDAKLRVSMNQNSDDFLILNYDNEITRNLNINQNGKVIYFSRKVIEPDFVCVSDDWIVVMKANVKVPICPVDEIFIQGSHNLENALAATAIAYFSGISPEVIRKSLNSFKGVEHRFEWVDKIEGIEFYNDSKGTNPDASIKAIESIKGQTVLIAGGMDKGSEFDEFIQAFDGKIKHLVLFGETSEIIKETAFEFGFKNVTITDGMENAVKLSFEIATSGENILLSPACASWDMYKSYEVRGDHFKTCVKSLRRG